jgi:threonine/homoserine/homoserine lactone efflux protein
LRPGYLSIELAKRGQYEITGLDISQSFGSLASLFVLVALPSGFVWLAFGAAVQHVLQSRRRLRIFNLAMAGLLALSILLIVR